VHEAQAVQGVRRGQRQVGCRGRVKTLLAQRDSGSILLAPSADHRVAAQGLTPCFDLGELRPCARRYRDIVLDCRVEPSRALALACLRECC